MYVVLYEFVALEETGLRAVDQFGFVDVYICM